MFGLESAKAALDDNGVSSGLNSKLTQLQKSKDDVVKEIQRLQQKLLTIEGDIKTMTSKLDEVKASKQKLKGDLSMGFAEVKALTKQVVLGTNESDTAVISSVDSIRMKAITTIHQFLQ